MFARSVPLKNDQSTISLLPLIYYTFFMALCALVFVSCRLGTDKKHLQVRWWLQRTLRDISKNIYDIKTFFFCFCISMKYSWRYGWKTLILEEKIPLGGTAEVLLVALLSFKAVKMCILHVGTCCFGWIYLYLKFTNLLAVMHINRFVVCCFHCAGWRISFVCCCVLVFPP